jgi:hypothetical protein
MIGLGLFLPPAAYAPPVGSEYPRSGYDPRPDFIAFDAHYRDKKTAERPEQGCEATRS